MSKNSNESLQINLGSLKVITLVETQGRFGNGQVGSLSVILFDRLNGRHLSSDGGEGRVLGQRWWGNWGLMPEFDLLRVEASCV